MTGSNVSKAFTHFDILLFVVTVMVLTMKQRPRLRRNENLSRARFRKEQLFFFDIAKHSIVDYVKHLAFCYVIDLVIDPAGAVALAYNC